MVRPSKVILVVSRTHWRCVSCKLHCSRTSSIEEHLETTHPQAPGLPSECVSDSELDTLLHNEKCYRQISADWSKRDILGPENNSSKLTAPRPSPAIVNKTESMCTAQGRRGRKAKRTSSSMTGTMRKVSEVSSQKRPKTETEREDSSLHPPDEWLPCDDVNEDEGSAEEKPVAGRRSSRRFMPTSRKNAMDKQKSETKKKPKTEGKEKQKLRTVDPETSVNNQTVSKKTTRVTRVGNEQNDAFSTSEVPEQLLPQDVSVPFPSSSQTTDHPKNKRKRSTLRSKTKKATKTRHKLVDKSQIATSCVPWLLDCGRKAGDKVVKKGRRTLLPEEKRALRRLYDVASPEKYGTGSSEISGTLASEAGRPSISAYAQKVPESSSSSLQSISSSTVISLLVTGQSSERQQTNVTYSMPPQNPKETILHASLQAYAMPSTTWTRQLHADSSVTVDRRSYANFTHQSNPHQTCSHPISQAVPTSDSAVRSSSSLSTMFTEPGSTADVAEPQSHVGSSSGGQCSVCEVEFPSLSKYNQHQLEVAKLETVECKRCCVKLHGLHELNLHVFSVHEVEKQGFCFLCDETSEGVEDLERHLHHHIFGCTKSLSEMRFHDCVVCNHELENKYSAIRKHYFQNHVKHVCPHCFLALESVAAYKHHVTKAHEGSTSYFCSICGGEFDSPDELDVHYANTCPEDIWAEDGKGDQCPKCGLWCPNRPTVEAHRKQHRSQDGVLQYRVGAKTGFPCMSCEKMFKNRHACRRHMKMVHEGVACYIHYCEYCGKGFLTKNHMRDHTALHHLNIKRYNCDYCQKQFVCGPTLRRHIRKEHTKHKPYKCPHCDERFFEKTPLQRHLTVHTGLAPFMCEQCGRGFYTKHNFQNHGSTHSQVKEFVCSGCQKGFTRKYNLQAHLKVCKKMTSS